MKPLQLARLCLIALAVLAGAFPVGYSEWNGIYRDSLRQAQNELGVMNYPSSVSGSSTFVEQDATDWTGSSSLFQWNRQPWNSTNFMDLHDGLTLNDVYSCNTANNSQAWPWGPSAIAHREVDASYEPV